MVSMLTSAPAHHSTLLRAHRGWRPLELAEFWRYRELLWFLTLRELQVRYRQMALGAAWAVIQPLMTMVVFTVFFGRLAKVPSDGVPYPLFSLAALVPCPRGRSGTTSSSISRSRSTVTFRRLAFSTAEPTSVSRRSTSRVDTRTRG